MPHLEGKIPFLEAKIMPTFVLPQYEICMQCKFRKQIKSDWMGNVEHWKEGKKADRSFLRG